MYVQADHDLMSSLERDYEALYQHATRSRDSRLQRGLSLRLGLLREVRHLMEHGQNPARVAEVARVILDDVRTMLATRGLNRSAVLLLKRREFGLEVLLGRISDVAANPAGSGSASVAEAQQAPSIAGVPA